MNQLLMIFNLFVNKFNTKKINNYLAAKMFEDLRKQLLNFVNHFSHYNYFNERFLFQFIIS